MHGKLMIGGISGWLTKAPRSCQRRRDRQLGLFSVDEILEAFTAAGMAASYDPHGLAGRGLYVASIAA